VTLDTCHVGANSEDLLAVYEVVRPLLKNVHLSDARHHGQHVQTHIMPGEGGLPLKELLATMARDGYDGLITLELHPREVGFIGKKRNLERLRHAREFVQSAIGAEAASLSER